jgi:exopolyphosphatase/guanosine-5'-triphosphate,3'-diphosphate pyrophosphatase
LTLVAAVDLGTNSMRLLISDGVSDIGRWEEVTGLGRGVDRTGVLSEEAMAASVDALRRFDDLMAGHGVTRRQAVATSAVRDAANRDRFLDAAAGALGVMPLVVDGATEARLAYDGATSLHVDEPPVLVSDIGGGSTEFVTSHSAVSVDIGSVRITERVVPSRPASGAELERAREMLGSLFEDVDPGLVSSLVGVAGTWTELPGLAGADDDVHVTRDEVAGVVVMLAGLSVEETARLPTLNPKRAPVILGGALIAQAVMDVCGVQRARVSIRDLLDGIVMGLVR